MKSIGLSIIIPVTERYDNIRDLFHDYKRAIETTGKTFETVFVLDGAFPEVLATLRSMKEEEENMRIITLARPFGEATALTVGLDHSSGDIVLTLPAYYQVKAEEIPRLITALEDQDMVVARRWPRIDSIVNRLQAGFFNQLLKLVSDLPLHDVGCGVRAFRRSVMEEVPIYGDLHRFLPVIAYQRGFKVREVDVAQSEKDAFQRLYPMGVYVRRLLDVLTIFFLVRFTKKPLRFFGLLGSSVLAVGGVLTLYIVTERLFFGVELSGRPALLLSSLLVVLGIQIFAIGLIGELVIFTHADEIKEYTVEEVLN